MSFSSSLSLWKVIFVSFVEGNKVLNIYKIFIFPVFKTRSYNYIKLAFIFIVNIF